VPVYEALELPWRPEATGSVAAEDGEIGWGEVAEALVEEYARHYELVDAELDEDTLALARRLAPEHRPPS
jgi:hypothetical protein